MIELYTSDLCPPCHKAKAWMKENGIEWVEKDPNQVILLTGSMELPTLVDGDTIIKGFKKETYEKHFKKNPKG